jgi:hypothetical protein
MSKVERRYQWLARFFGHSFLVAGLLFAIAPERVVAFLMWEGALLGLEGDLQFGQGTLSWALALSLMAVLVLLARQTAARPRDPAPYRALVLSKLVSTAVFMYLAFLHGPVWVLAALTDFSIAVVLVIARLPISDAIPVPGFAGRYLRWMGVDEAGRRHYSDMVARLPWTARVAVRYANRFLTWLGPLLLLGRPVSGGALGDDAMERLVSRLRASESAPVRLLWIVLHQPACGVLAAARCKPAPAAPTPSLAVAQPAVTPAE